MTVKHIAGSPVERVSFQGYTVFVKRDDLLDPAFSGNKARKLHYLLNSDFSTVSKVVGYGSPQSNLLYSLSALAKLKGWQCDFYVDHIPRFLRDNAAGNYLAALGNGANIISLQQESLASTVGEYVQKVVMPGEKQALFIPEGGHSDLAEPGIECLADEIKRWALESAFDDIKVMLPSGTGTTALYLQKHLPFEVLTCSCVGGDEYLETQFLALSNGRHAHPSILPTNKKYHFGKLYTEFYDMWLRLKTETGIEFELLYDPLGWITLLDFLQQGGLGSSNVTRNDNSTAVLYVHQGGVMGNATMVPRYIRKNRR